MGLKALVYLIGKGLAVPGQEQKSQGRPEFLVMFGGGRFLDFRIGITLRTQGSISQKRFKVLGTLETGERPIRYPRSEVGTEQVQGPDSAAEFWV